MAQLGPSEGLVPPMNCAPNGRTDLAEVEGLPSTYAPGTWR